MERSLNLNIATRSIQSQALFACSASWNNADMGGYSAAINTTGVPPDVTLTRQGGNRKYGAGLNAEQEITPDLGSFMRLGWNDGHTETPKAFDEVDRTA